MFKENYGERDEEKLKHIYVDAIKKRICLPQYYSGYSLGISFS